MKKVFLILLVSLTIISAKEDKITFAGPFATVSHPFFQMIESKALNDVAKKIEFKLWKNPDELRSLILRGDVDFIAIPTNVAANLYNKKQKLKLLNVSIWGILGFVSRDKTLKTLKDFKGKEILVPFREDMPDIVLKELIKAQGMDYKKDFKFNYVSSPVDAMQMLILRRADHALLAEPAISIALRKTKSFPISVIAPTLFRSVDLQKEWGKVFNTEAKIPQAGVAVVGDMIGKKQIIKRFQEEYKKALQWYKENPKKAAKLTIKNLPMLEENGVADSISNIKLEDKDAFKVKNELESFFKILEKSNPKLIGGKLPNIDFYYK